MFCFYFHSMQTIFKFLFEFLYHLLIIKRRDELHSLKIFFFNLLFSWITTLNYCGKKTHDRI